MASSGPMIASTFWKNTIPRLARPAAALEPFPRRGAVELDDDRVVTLTLQAPHAAGVEGDQLHGDGLALVLRKWLSSIFGRRPAWCQAGAAGLSAAGLSAAGL